MATLVELKQIQTNSVADAGEPPDSNIVAARELLGKIEVAIWKEAQQRISGTDLPAGDTPEANQARNEAIGWAQRVIGSADAEARTVLKLLLATNATATVAQILGASDTAIESAVNNLIPRLSTGFFPGRR